MKCAGGGSVNIHDEKHRKDIYFENAFVALKSVKIHNSLCDVGLITNQSVPAKYDSLFKSHDINIWEVPFEEFVFSKKNKWHLAFYKLASLKYAIDQLNYENYIQIDCDVVCISSLNALIEDIKYKLVMLSGPYQFDHPTRKLLREINEYLTCVKKTDFNPYNQQKWGSGLIAGNTEILRKFMSKCTDLYEALNDDSLPFYNKLGDEVITSIAGEMMYEDLMDGKAYMNVYWTARHFYLVSTNYHFDKMCFLHLPDEKENGIRRIYKKLVNGIEFEQINLQKILNLPSTKAPFNLRLLMSKIKRRIFK